MKLRYIVAATVAATLVCTSALSAPPNDKTVNKFCLSDKECIDIVSLELDSLYNQGLNEISSPTVGTLINRKAKSLSDYCTHSDNRRLCESYKNQLMLRYMSGLLDREKN